MRYAVILVMMSLVGVSFVVSAGESGVRRVGVSLSLSGEYSESGKKALAGVKLRVEDYNNAIPVGGKPLELVIKDDESIGSRAAANVVAFAEEGVNALIGPLSSGLMLAMDPEAARLGVVMVSPSATSPKLGRSGDWAFRVLFDDEFQGVALARFLAGKMNLKRVATIINDKFAYAHSMFNAFAEEFSKLGGTVTAEEHYSFVADDRVYDFTDILTRIDRSDPDIVLLPLHSAEVADIILRSTQMKLKMRFCGGDTWQHENILLAGGNNLENAYYIGSIDYDSGTPQMRHFIELFDRSNDPYAQLSSVMGYDAASVLIEGMKNGESGEEIKKGLYGIRNFPLASGTISVNPGRGSEKSAYIHRINMTDGQFKSVIVDEIMPTIK